MSADTSFSAAKAKSTSTFISALIISSSVAGIQLAAFLILRTSIRKIYAPRTYLPVPSKRAQPVSATPWGWLLPTLTSSSESMIPTAGLDAYMYIRFLKMMIFIFAPISVLVSAVLLPLNAVGTKLSTTGLNSFAFGNIPEDQQIRYVGHLICAYAVTIWTVFLIQKEMANYIQLRQRYITRQSHLDLPQSRTVLATGVPKHYLSPESLNSLTAHLPGGIKRVWISRELKTLPELYNDRLKRLSMLESAETKLIKAATKQSRSSRPIDNRVDHHRSPHQVHPNDQTVPETDPVDRFVRRKSRPTHRLGFLGLFGKKVDTIDWCKDEIVRLSNLLEEAREKLDQHHPHNSAFIEFNDIVAAQIFSQIVLHQKPLRMAKRYVDAAPQDIIWDNLNINPYDERIRNMVSWVITVGLVILWSFPVAFIGSLSNVTSLCSTVHWLSWLCKTHNHIQDVVQGILPPVLLALIFLILPMLLRLIGRYSGVPRISEIELILMTRYYLFLVIHGFIVTTLSSGLTAAIPELSKDPSQAVTILTVNLPTASIFFMTYMVTTSLTSSSGALLQIFNLIIYYLKLFVLASTPRSVFNVRYEMAQPQFGTLFPNTTLLATLGLVYSVTAPIMTILALVAFTLYWVVYKYLFLFVFDVPAAHETGGRFFPLAMNHIFIGLYFCQLCLAGLFFLARDVAGNASSISQGALMIVLFVATCFSHVLIRNSYAPLTMFVPLNMLEEEGVSRTPNPEHGILLSPDKQSTFTGTEKVRFDDNLTSPSSKEFPCSSTSDPHLTRSHSFECPTWNSSNPVSQSSSLSRLEASEFSQKVLTPIGEDVGEEYLSTPSAQRPRLDKCENAGGASWEEENFVPELGRTAFLHPAVWENTRPVWIPEDPMGIAKLEVSDMKLRKIPASLRGAGVTSSGAVFVTRSPPETAEVIELKRNKVQGIFAIPGAIGGVARAAGGTISGKVMRTSSSHTNRSHSRNHSGSSLFLTGVQDSIKSTITSRSIRKQDRRRRRSMTVGCDGTMHRADDDDHRKKHMSQVMEEESAPTASTTTTTSPSNEFGAPISRSTMRSLGSSFDEDEDERPLSFNGLQSSENLVPSTSTPFDHTISTDTEVDRDGIVNRVQSAHHS